MCIRDRRTTSDQFEEHLPGEADYRVLSAAERRHVHLGGRRPGRRGAADGDGRSDGDRAGSAYGAGPVVQAARAPRPSESPPRSRGDPGSGWGLFGGHRPAPRRAGGLRVGGLRRDGVPHLSLIHISEPTRLGMISYAVFCLKKKKNRNIYKRKTKIIQII